MPYIQRIEVFNHYRQPDFALDLGEPAAGAEFRHLILTGPNASGKTTILGKLGQVVAQDSSGTPAQRRATVEDILKNREEVLVSRGNNPNRGQIEQNIRNLREQLGQFTVEPTWTPEPPEPPGQLAAVVGARRTLAVDKANGVEKVQLDPAALLRVFQTTGDPTRYSLARHFLKHLVNLNVQARLARAEESDAAVALEAWLERLEAALAELFEIPGLKMKFVRQDYDIRFVAPDGSEWDFNQLADGHASVLNILAEVLLRVDEASLTADGAAFASPAGVVIIDEIETHLHPSLQERLLPFLTHAFPRMQFIVATHSPAVISSIDNALVWDLKSHQGIPSEELRGTPYGDLMKIHFGIETDIDLESTKQLQRLKDLRDLEQRTEDQEREYVELAGRLRKTSQALALEVWTQLEQAKTGVAGE